MVSLSTQDCESLMNESAKIQVLLSRLIPSSQRQGDPVKRTVLDIPAADAHLQLYPHTQLRAEEDYVRAKMFIPLSSFAKTSFRCIKSRCDYVEGPNPWAIVQAL